jgi:hypothetical protein
MLFMRYILFLLVFFSVKVFGQDKVVNLKVQAIDIKAKKENNEWSDWTDGGLSAEIKLTINYTANVLTWQQKNKGSEKWEYTTYQIIDKRQDNTYYEDFKISFLHLTLKKDQWTERDILCFRNCDNCADYILTTHTEPTSNIQFRYLLSEK